MVITPKDMLIYYVKLMVKYSGTGWSVKLQRMVEKLFAVVQEIIEWVLFLPVMVWCLFEVAYKVFKAYIKIWRNKDGNDNHK